MKSQKPLKMRNLFFKSLTLFLLMLLFPVASKAQSNTIVHVDELLNNSSSSLASRRVAPNQLGKLLKDKHDAIYISNNVAKVYGESPVVLFTDVASIGGLNAGKYSTSNVKIIIISIESSTDLSAQLDVLKLERFQNLEYVYFKSEVAISASDINRMVKGELPSSIFIYKQENDM
jgi:hypothetical protein